MSITNQATVNQMTTNLVEAIVLLPLTICKYQNGTTKVGRNLDFFYLIKKVLKSFKKFFTNSLFCYIIKVQRKGDRIAKVKKMKFTNKHTEKQYQEVEHIVEVQMSLDKEPNVEEKWSGVHGDYFIQVTEKKEVLVRVGDYQVYVNNYTTYSVEHLQEAKRLTRATEKTLDDLNSVYDWEDTCSDIISDNLNTLEEARNELKSYENKYELEGNSRVLKQTYFINKHIFDIDGELINSESIESGDSHIHTFFEGDK